MMTFSKILYDDERNIVMMNQNIVYENQNIVYDDFRTKILSMMNLEPKYCL